MSSEPPFLLPQLGRLTRPALFVGLGGAAGCAIMAWLAPGAFFPAYLAAYHFVLGIGLGCLVLLMIYHLTGGAWGFLLRRILEAGTRTLPLLAILFLPLALGLGVLFPWAQPGAADSEQLRHQRPYMNAPFFFARAAAYFGVWVCAALLLEVWSRRQERSGDPVWVRRLGTASAIGLVCYGVTIHFASIDWLLALQPAFRSTIFGLLMGSGQLLTAHAVAVIVFAVLVRGSALGEYASPDAVNDLGNLMLTFVVVFGYMVYFQFMLIWITNLPSEVAWYLPRLHGAWGTVSLALIVAHLGMPFFALLARDVKRSPRALACVGGLLLAAHAVYDFQTVLPAFSGAAPGYAVAVAAVVAVLAVGGLWAADFLWELGRRPLVPAHDPSAEAALTLLRESEEVEEHAEEPAHA
jgi:hypothetical protein